MEDWRAAGIGPTKIGPIKSYIAARPGIQILVFYATRCLLLGTSFKSADILTLLVVLSRAGRGIIETRLVKLPGIGFSTFKPERWSITAAGRAIKLVHPVPHVHRHCPRTLPSPEYRQRDQRAIPWPTHLLKPQLLTRRGGIGDGRRGGLRKF